MISLPAVINVKDKAELYTRATSHVASYGDLFVALQCSSIEPVSVLTHASLGASCAVLSCCVFGRNQMFYLHLIHIDITESPIRALRCMPMALRTIGSPYLVNRIPPVVIISFGELFDAQ